MSALLRRFVPWVSSLAIALVPVHASAQDRQDGHDVQDGDDAADQGAEADAPSDEADGADGADEQPSAIDQEARQLFEAGRIAFNDGRFADALQYFERSHELSGRPELLFNIGSAADRMRDNQRALDAFEAYLEERPDAPNRREVEGRIRVLRATLVATPAEAAAQSTDTGTTEPAPAAPPEDDSGSILGQWWLWTIVGVVVAGGVVTAVLLTRDGGGGQDDLVLGDDGVVHYTLESP